MNQYKAAIVGYGNMGRWYRLNVSEKQRVLITGAYDIEPQRMEKAREDGLKTYPSYEALLADDEIDIVVVATPNNFHLPQACQAMEAGKFVVSEKPVAMSSAELQEMMDCSKGRASVSLSIKPQGGRRLPRDSDAVDKGLLGSVFR